MLILLDPGHGLTPLANAPQTEPSSKLPTIAKSPNSHYPNSKPTATTPDSSSLKPKASPQRTRPTRQRPLHRPRQNQRPPISLHLNVAGDGTKWMNATGWSWYTCKGQTESDRLADCLYKAAEQILENQVIRTDYARDGDPDWEENFYLLRKTLCVAVLSENYFMDNKSDLEYLQSRVGKQAIVDTHVEGLIEYIETMLL